ncbi:MAG: ectoine/hydroxyectoine ABC transporter substrate-binding protein EhuB [Candidatus Nitrospinota bacterium M3_3B_026]
MTCPAGRGWRTALLILLALFLAAGAGCQAREKEKGGAYGRMLDSGVVRVGFANEAPYAFLDEDGRLTGEAPEIIRAVMNELGVERVEGVLTEFGSLIPGLKAGRFDIIAAGMYITPERCRQIAFTNPTYRMGEAFLVRKGNPLDLHGYEDVKEKPAARLGVVAGAVELGYAIAVGVPRKRISVLPDAPSAVGALMADRIDAYAGTSLTVRDMYGKSEDADVEIAEPFTDPVIDGKTAAGYGAFGLRKEDGRLLKRINKTLDDFIGSERHRKLVAPFGFGEAQLPGDKTAAELCERGA